MNKSLKIALIVLSIVVVAACALVIVGANMLNNLLQESTTQPTVSVSLPTQLTIPTPIDLPEQPLDEDATKRVQANEDTLLSEIVPINDPIALAERLGGKENVPTILIDTDAPYQVGDKKLFGFPIPIPMKTFR